MKTTKWVVAAALTTMVACTDQPSPDWSATSSSLALSKSGDALYVADGDNGMVVRIDLEDGRLEQLVVGEDPKRVTRLGGHVYVTLGAEGAVAMIAEKEDGLELVQTIFVGAEPYGIAAHPQGEAVYVALGTEGAVVALDPTTLAEIDRFAIPGEPRWVVAHPRGRVIYVASAQGGGVYRVDLSSGDVRDVELPVQNRGVFDETNDRMGDGQDLVELVPRVTGDPALSPDGSSLAVPSLYVDNHTPVNGSDANTGDFEVFESGGYASGNIESGLTRFNPAIVTFSLDASGDIDNEGVAVLVAGRGSTDPTHDHVLGENGHGASDIDLVQKGDLVRGYLSNLVFDPTGRTILATIEGGRTIAVVPAEPVQPGIPFDDFDDGDAFFGSGDFESSVMSFVGVEDGPQGIVFSDDETAWSFNFLSRSVSKVDWTRAEEGIATLATDEGMFFNNVASWYAGAEYALPPSLLAPDVLEGRRLFFSSGNSAMAVPGAGVSCATCHFGGRNDGLTWTFDIGVRQTPSLAGEVSLTAPVTWTSEVESVAEEAFLTSQGRMGGNGIRRSQTLDIEAFIDWTRDVEVPEVELAAVERGREIFTRADVGCATCHVGERLTDNRSYSMFGLEAVNTPGLQGLAATAPYLHDGSAATLLDVVEMADAGRMGHTAHLSSDEKADLVVFMKSL